jgi:uncharacterized protein (TIRG00374 family)
MTAKRRRKNDEPVVTPLRVIALVVTAVALYLLFPSLSSTFSKFPKLRDAQPAWVALSLLCEVLSFVCVWRLLTIALRTTKWYAVATTQIASNALGQAVPAGAAAGATLQYRMLKGADIDTAEAGSGIAAATGLQYASLAALPVIALPLVAGRGAPPNLLKAAWIGVAAFVVIVSLLAVLMLWQRAPTIVGRGIQWLLNLRPKHSPVENLPERLRHQRDQIADELGEHWVPSLLAAVGKWAFDFGALLAALAAAGAKPDPALILLAYTASAVLTMIPITPGGLGFVEAGLGATLALAGIGASEAVVATLQYRLVAYWLPLLLGPLAAVLYRRRYKPAGDKA